MSDAAEVLVLANLHDFPTDRVCLALQRRGVSYARLNRETLPSASIRLNPLEPRLDIDVSGVAWHVTDAVRAVYWRQPTFSRNAPGVALTLDQQLERSQWGAFVRSLMLFRRAHWVNDPAATYRAECKPWQLRFAHDLGLRTPKTFVTNDPNAPISDLLGSTVVVKPVDTVLLREGDMQHFAYASYMPWDEVAGPELSAVPVIIQEPIEPKTDIRVTVVGDRLWAVAIVTGAGGVVGDWRLQRKADLHYEDIELPADVRTKCITLVREMELAFGGIDLAKRGDEFVFLEINPSGEWGWLDGATRPIAEAIADELLS